jgi:soluble lytic murein transglycosylase
MKNKALLITIIFALLLSSCDYHLTIPSVTATAVSNSDQTASPFIPTPTLTPSPQNLLTAGMADFYTGDFDTALNDLTVAEASPDPEIIAGAMLYVGRIYLQKQNYQTAIEKLGYLVNTQPVGDSRNTAFFFLAQAYEGLQQYQLAADAYQNYLHLNNNAIQADILEMEGDDLVNSGNNTAALAAYQAAVPLARPEYLDEVKLKVAEATAATGDAASAINQYLDLYNTSNSNYTKSSVNLLLGRLYLQQDMTDQAYARFQDSVIKFPTTYDTYSGLVQLIEANQPVDDLLRAIVDFNADQYGLAVSALERYMTDHPDHDATANYYKAYSYYYMGDYQNEVAEWDKLIQDFPNDPKYYADAFLEKASTQWGKLQQYSDAAQTLLTYVAQAPTSDVAASYLYTAGQIYEEGNLLSSASQTWQRVISEYPAYEKAILAQFDAGICEYRLGNYSQALVVFQKNALATSVATDKARAELWIGKTQLVLNQKNDALASFKQASTEDPTGYYSIRAGELLNGQSPFATITSLDLGVDLGKEKSDAVDWMHSKFNLPADVDLLSSGDLANNVLYQRGDAFWKLGLTIKAQSEFDSLRQQLTTDPANSFRLMNHLLDLGINQTAILCARQILDILGLGDATLIDQTPAYFNHVRFGVYFRDIVVASANENTLDSLVIFSLIRQESFFEPEITSSQGATGLMQILSSSGKEIASDYGWPSDYIDQDLTRPLVNIKLGTHYLAKWYSYFNDDMAAALAAYNGGIGYAMDWMSSANNDPDLMLEIIPDYFETGDYVRFIREDLEIYKTVYYRP